MIIGVTSWGYSSPCVNLMGSSWFGQNEEYPSSAYKDGSGKNYGAGNIGAIMRKVCGEGEKYLRYQAKGYCE